MTTKSKTQLENEIRQTARHDSSRIIMTPHVKKRMRERKISLAMVMDTLKNGHIRMTPEPNLAKGSTECRMEHYTAGKDIGVVVGVLEDDPHLIIITAMFC